MKLNLGCGRDTRQDYVNLDIAEIKGVDVVHDVNKVPLPFEDNYFHEILCNDIIEHVDLVPVMKDLHRILRNKGRITIRVPHFTSRNNYVDPTHKSMFSAFTWDFFVKNGPAQRDYYFDFHFSRVRSRRITFERPWGIPLFFLVDWLVNISDVTRRVYEASFLSCFFPAENVVVVLVKEAKE